MTEVLLKSYQGLQAIMRKAYIKKSIENETNKLFFHVDGNLAQDMRGVMKLCFFNDDYQSFLLRHGITSQKHFIGRCTEIGLALYSQVKM